MTEDGGERHAPLLGMDAEDEWVLNGNMSDKSLMRNYIAFTVAAEIVPYTPDLRYCEVLLRNGDELRYEGVYLLTESVKQGPGRVDVSSERPRSGECSFILRRDRYDPDRPMLRTYAESGGLAKGYLGLLYPKKDKLDAAALRYIEGYIDAFERRLYSDDVGVFMKYGDYIDVESFADYYLLNEFFANYDAGWNSTYFYKDLGGKLRAGPVWDYDSIMDNYIPQPMDPEELLFGYAPWFDRLIRHSEFVDRLVARYSELRWGPLSPERIDTAIQEIARYLKPAWQRDWLRWHDIYAGSTYALRDETVGIAAGMTAAAQEHGPERLIRRTDSFDEELLKLRHLLRAHGDAVAGALPNLPNEGAASVSESDDRGRNALLVTLFMLAFASAAWIARRHGGA
jgi:hypothetical protein